MVSKFPYMVRFMDNKFFYESIIFSYYGNILMKERALPYMILFFIFIQSKTWLSSSFEKQPLEIGHLIIQNFEFFMENL